MLRLHVISAVFLRNVLQYFSGVLGYLFIVAFVTMGAFLAFDEQFFANNLANLDQLSSRYSLLLLFLIPAITMSCWADEKKLGTDELLFTFPATDVEILLGKYLAVLAVYSIGLAFTFTHLLMLAWVGDPDWGQVFATYVGYWLAGAALLSAGMFASVLTRSTTVAFVLGAVICAVPVFIGSLPWIGGYLGDFSIDAQLQDFYTGLIPLSGVLYFVSLTCFMLYLNLVFIAHRHWSSGREAAMSAQFAIRSVSLAAILTAFCFMADKSGTLADTDIDLTSENLFTLSEATHDVLQKAEQDERQLTIQAFLSPDPPREFVHVHKQLTGLLSQYNRLGGSWVDVRFVDVTPNSTEADEARLFGIEPRRVRTERNGRTIEEDVYLGVVVSSNLDEVVLPFFEDGTALEYELTRSLATVTRKERFTVGILLTDAHFFGRSGSWPYYERMLGELKKQFNVIEVTTDDLRGFVDAAQKKKTSDKETKEPKDDQQEQLADDSAEKKKKDPPDVVVAVAPSSLTPTRMQDFVDYVKQGFPCLIFDDPLPFYPVTYMVPSQGAFNAPVQPRATPDSRLGGLTTAPRLPTPPLPRQYSQLPPGIREQLVQRYYRENPAARPRFEPKADGGTARSLTEALGIRWDSGTIVTDYYDPNPDFKPKWPPEDFVEPRMRRFYGPLEHLFLFVGRGSGNDSAFQAASPITSGLQQMLLFYAGAVEPMKEAKTTFLPLLQTGRQSGLLTWEEATSVPTTRVRQHDPASGELRVAEEKATSVFTRQPLRRITPRPPRYDDSDVHTLAARITAKKGEKDAAADINVVFVADVDMLTNMYFEQQEALGRPLDNVAFVYNAIEVLAGDDSYAALRSRRPRPRTLTEVRARTDAYRKQRRDEQRAAEKRIADALKTARERVQQEQEKISQNKELGIIQKAQSLALTAETEQQRFDNEKKKLDRELEQTIDRLKATEQRQIREFENNVRLLAVALPPVPALLLGIVVLSYRQYNERRNTVASRRV